MERANSADEYSEVEEEKALIHAPCFLDPEDTSSIYFVSSIPALVIKVPARRYPLSHSTPQLKL